MNYASFFCGGGGGEGWMRMNLQKYTCIQFFFFVYKYVEGTCVGCSMYGITKFIKRSVQ